MNRQKLLGFALLVAMAGLAGTLSAGPVAEVQNYGDALVFSPEVREYEHIILTVTGPCNYVTREVIEEGDLVFQLSNETIDGNYTAELVVIPRVESGIISVLKQARASGDNSEVDQLCRDGKLPGDPATQTDGFLISKGKIIYNPKAVEKSAPAPKSSDFSSFADAALLSNASAADVTSGVPTKDFVINDDLIVDGSACIGFDCVNGESFGFDTIRLKENNLRIKFDDTSVAASFPRNDWQLTANDSANGGASKFSIDDISGGRTPFTVEANARSHSLYVDDGGRIGNRTSTPSTEIHTIDGDTPTLRLQQDGSSGFAPQTWDVAGNETNFFIRDVSNGSQLPFRIRPGAPTSSIFIDVDGDVGVGTASPSNSLHVRRTDGTAKLLVEEASGTAADRTVMELVNNGRTDYVIRNTNASTATSGWTFSQFNNGRFVIRAIGAGAGFFMEEGGAGTFEGDLTVDGTFSNPSSRTLKNGFAPVDRREMLQRVADLPITRWTYSADENQRQHIGPVTEDFQSLFGLGTIGRNIIPLDVQGVTLAALQGLNEVVEEKDAKIAELEGRLAALEKLLLTQGQ